MSFGYGAGTAQIGEGREGPFEHTYQHNACGRCVLGNRNLGNFGARIAESPRGLHHGVIYVRFRDGGGKTLFHDAHFETFCVAA